MLIQQTTTQLMEKIRLIEELWQKKWVKTDKSFACFDVMEVTAIQTNSIKLEFGFEKKLQDLMKKSMNRLKKLIQNSQTMLLNTQPKDFQFSINKTAFDVF